MTTSNVYTVTISGKGNSVNMAKTAYHHGDLRTALLTAGLRLLAERDGDDLSLREVAREVGVSATAVYRHFPDKSALMAALAQDGLDRLAAAQHEAAEQAGGGAAGFAATGRAYVRFALANPALFRLIFTSSIRTDAEACTVSQAMAFLRVNAAEAAPDGADAQAIRVIALQAWALVHGLSMLMLDGQIETDERLIDLVVAPDAVR
jgi:AcrR family transcriptional regulator